LDCVQNNLGNFLWIFFQVHCFWIQDLVTNFLQGDISGGDGKNIQIINYVGWSRGRQNLFITANGGNNTFGGWWYKSRNSNVLAQMEWFLYKGSLMPSAHIKIIMRREQGGWAKMRI
jgi:hypothetical protein